MQVQEYIENIKWRMHSGNREALTPVLKAFESNDPAKYEKYLVYGDSRTLALNYACMQVSEKFGITREMYEEHLEKSAGWYNCVYILEKVESIQLGKSHISVKRTPNGMYLRGISFNYYNGGSHYGASVYDGIGFRTKEEAIEDGLKELKAEAKRILKMQHYVDSGNIIKDLLKAIELAEAPQLTLF